MKSAIRIIPARAGPTRRTARRDCRRSDHPRSCGANASTGTPLFAPTGSSPLVRGQHAGILGLDDYVRIIPARAGPTAHELTSVLVEPDHPRSCGANTACPCF